MLNKDLVKICSRLNQLKPSTCTLQAWRAVWIKTVEERSKNVFYELSQGLKVVATFGAGKVCDGAGLFPRKCVMMVFNGFIISFLKYSFRIVICPEGEKQEELTQ